MELNRIRENRTKMLLQFAIPSIIAMVLTSMINVADGFFVGNYVGKEGIAAVNLGLPIVYLYLAVGLMIGVGGIAIAGRNYGAGKIDKCNQIFRQTMLTSILFTIVISIFIFLCFNPILKILHADGITAQYFREYYTIMLLELPLMVINSCFGMFIRGEGSPSFFMAVNVVTVVMNIVLDYLFSGWCHWGMQGVAAASLISALAALVLSCGYFMKKAKVYHFGKLSFDKEVLRETIFNGGSEFIGEMAMCISMFAYNFVIMHRIGVDGVSAFTIVGYVAYVFSMIIVGFGQGASPLMSFCYGAEYQDLTKKIRNDSSKFVLGAGIVTILLMFSINGWYSSLFVKNEDVVNMAKNGIFIFVWSFLFSGINEIGSFYFTSIGKAIESAVISASRGLIILLICIFTLPVIFGMTGVWLVAPITEFLTFFITVMFYVREKRK